MNKIIADKPIKEMSSKEIKKYLSNRAKVQNEKSKENYDTFSCKLPKGTRERIKAQNLTFNGLVNKLVLEELNRLELANKSVAEPLETHILRQEEQKQTTDINELQAFLEQTKKDRGYI